MDRSAKSPGSTTPVDGPVGGPVDIVVHLLVQPSARRDEIVGPQGDALKIRVAAPADRGRANRAALALLAAGLGVPESRLTLVAGAGSRSKRVRVEGADPIRLRELFAPRPAL